MSQCEECESGKADEDKNAATKCSDCKPGKYSDKAATVCTPCEGGKAGTASTWADIDTGRGLA